MNTRQAARSALWLNMLSQWPDNHACFARRTSIIALLLQGSLSIAAAFTLVALHGDGAWFVFSLGTGEPWALKWAKLASRAATYVTIVAPTEGVAYLLHLNGRQIAAAYGFVFNLVPTAQFAACLMLGWRRHSCLLIFPLAQYVFANALGFGYMSEVLIGPGFFWICFFLVLRHPLPLLWFAICFAALLFSHEVMIPSALLVVMFAWSQLKVCNKGKAPLARRAALVFICGSTLVFWIVVRLSGAGAEADRNPLTTFDPGRVLNNPTLWIIAIVAGLLVCTGGTCVRKIGGRGLMTMATACVAIPVLLHPWLNFAQGRYDSARTLIGLMLLLFGGWAILTYTRPPSLPHADSNGSLQAIMPVAVSAALAINMGASIVFLWDWTTARDGFERLVRSEFSFTQAVNANNFATYEQVRPYLSSAEQIANERMDFSWTWPFRSAVLATDYHPTTFIFDPSALFEVCVVMQSVHLHSDSAPANTFQSIRSLACLVASPPPKRPGFFTRLIDHIKSSFQGDGFQ